MRFRRQWGLTLIELMISMTLALFLVGGVLTLVGRTRQTFGAQNQLSQLQDNQRLAMTLLSEVIESSGFFPDPTVELNTTALPAVGTIFAAGQSIYGVSAATTGGDSITSRFLTASNDGVINCTGGSNTTAGSQLYTNAFSVNATTNQLMCALNGAQPVALVTGVTNLSVLYGVKTGAVDNGTADSYLKASEMTATNWGNVISVRATLTFNNPLAGQPGQVATIPFTRVIGVMNKAGVKK